MGVYCYHVIITFCYKVSDLKKKESKVRDVQACDLLSRH